MWQFAITLFLLQLYPGSLLLVGVYGLVMQLAVVVFGTIVGDWVDNNPRMRGRWVGNSPYCITHCSKTTCYWPNFFPYQSHFMILSEVE